MKEVKPTIKNIGKKYHYYRYYTEEESKKQEEKWKGKKKRTFVSSGCVCPFEMMKLSEGKLQQINIYYCWDANEKKIRKEKEYLFKEKGQAPLVKGVIIYKRKPRKRKPITNY